MARKKVLNIRSNQVDTDGTPKLPTADQIDYGEIAVNYAAGVETLAIKNSDDEIVTFSSGGGCEYGDLATALSTHLTDKDNPHRVTQTQVGLSDVNNTSDADKPVSTAQQTALDTKVNTADVVTDTSFEDETVYGSDKVTAANVAIALYDKLNEVSGGASGDISDLIARVAALEEEVEGIEDYEDSIASEEDCLFCDIIDGVEEYFQYSNPEEACVGVSSATTPTCS
ncbi:MAG: hypothetical protein LUD72_04085 [Bacteroidales bacterium]|nr:hypothetical protein [Bacteroidales bacterium]